MRSEFSVPHRDGPAQVSRETDRFASRYSVNYVRIFASIRPMNRFRDWISSRRDAATMVLLFIVVTISCSYFFTGGGWNQASRFDLVRAIIDKHTLRIDAYADNTGDKAAWHGHYYSDKAPGTALLAVPFAAAARKVASGFSANEESILMAEARASLLVCSAIPTALATAAIYATARRMRSRRRGATIAAWAYGLGSPAWVYGTFFWGHALAAACLITAFGLTLRTWDLRWSKRTVRLSALVGLLLGWAVITEYTAAVVALVVVGLSLIKRWQHDWRSALKYVASIALGALGPLAILGVYNRLAFGSPFHLGYSSVVGWTGMNRGLFGITWPSLAILKQLLVGQERGILWLSPVLVLAPIGLLVFLRRSGSRAAGIAAVSIFVYYLLLNASYAYWDGGHTYGPRHLAAGLPFLYLGLATPWCRHPLGCFVLKSLAIVSVALTLMGIATQPMTPPVQRPLAEVYWPSFMQGRLSQNDYAYFNSGGTPSQNWGETVGLRGLVSLVPLLFIWKLADAGLTAVLAENRPVD